MHMNRDLFGVLRTRRGRTPEHHRSFADCIERSWCRLSPTAQAVARFVATQDARVSFDAIEGSMAGTDGDIFDAIEDLTSCSFASVDANGDLELPRLHRHWVQRFGAQETAPADAPTMRRPR